MNRDWETTLSACREILSAHDDVEAVLLFLRQSGYFKMDAIKALIALQGMGLEDAKRTVHFSRTWQDRREADEQLELLFWDEVSRWAEESEREHTEKD